MIPVVAVSKLVHELICELVSLTKCKAAALINYRRATEASSIQNTKRRGSELRLVLKAVPCEGLIVIRDIPVGSYVELVWVERLAWAEDVVVIGLTRDTE